MAAVRPTHVLLFQDDFKRMENWVLQYPDLETGGQLFGLWTQAQNPYINVVIGPGANCRHETHSFHQDINYLKDVGGKLNKDFMMCHIGEWHSHHRLRLRQPSSGDLNSVWNNFPKGIEYLLLIIATIEAGVVKLWPWIFSANTRSYESIDLKIIEKRNVFMRDGIVANHVKHGAEVTVVQPPSLVGKVKKCIEEWRSGSEDMWFHSKSGVYLVQILNAELEKLADKRQVEKMLVRHPEHAATLQISFRRNTTKYVISFPHNFPESDVTVTCTTRDQSRQPPSWTVSMQDSANVDCFVKRLVESLCSFASNELYAIWRF